MTQISAALPPEYLKWKAIAVKLLLEEDLTQEESDLVCEAAVARSTPPPPLAPTPERKPGECPDHRPCVNMCGSGACSRHCQVCGRLAYVPSAPCPACPDAWMVRP